MKFVRAWKNKLAFLGAPPPPRDPLVTPMCGGDPVILLTAIITTEAPKRLKKLPTFPTNGELLTCQWTRFHGRASINPFVTPFCREWLRLWRTPVVGNPWHDVFASKTAQNLETPDCICFSDTLTEENCFQFTFRYRNLWMYHIYRETLISPESEGRGCVFFVQIELISI